MLEYQLSLPTTCLWTLLIQTTYSLPGPRNSSFQSCIHPQTGTWPLTQLCLSAHSKVWHGVQQSTCRFYGHAQHTFLQFCHCYSLLPIPADQKTLLYFATFLANAKGLKHGTVIGYVYRVWALHIDMGLSDLLKGALACINVFGPYIFSLTQNLESWPSHTIYWYWPSLYTSFLPWPWPISVFFEQAYSWWIRNASTWHNTCAFRMWPPAFPPSQSYNTLPSTLWSARSDPFRQGVDMIIDCSGTQVWGAHAEWDLIQSHQVRQASPTALFFQLAGQPLSRDIMVCHIKDLLAKLGLNPAFYSGHSLCIGGATTATMAGLRDWEIMSLGHWKNNTYWTYIREMTDMRVACAGGMAHTLASIAFNYSCPYHVKDKL